MKEYCKNYDLYIINQIKISSLNLDPAIRVRNGNFYSRVWATSHIRNKTILPNYCNYLLDYSLCFRYLSLKYKLDYVPVLASLPPKKCSYYSQGFASYKRKDFLQPDQNVKSIKSLEAMRNIGEFGVIKLNKTKGLKKNCKNLQTKKTPKSSNIDPLKAQKNHITEENKKKGSVKEKSLHYLETDLFSSSCSINRLEESQNLLRTVNQDQENQKMYVKSSEKDTKINKCDKNTERLAIYNENYDKSLPKDATRANPGNYRKEKEYTKTNTSNNSLEMEIAMILTNAKNSFVNKTYYNESAALTRLNSLEDVKNEHIVRKLSSSTNNVRNRDEILGVSHSEQNSTFFDSKTKNFNYNIRARYENTPTNNFQFSENIQFCNEEKINKEDNLSNFHYPKSYQRKYESLQETEKTYDSEESLCDHQKENFQFSFQRKNISCSPNYKKDDFSHEKNLNDYFYHKKYEDERIFRSVNFGNPNGSEEFKKYDLDPDRHVEITTERLDNYLGYIPMNQIEHDKRIFHEYRKLSTKKDSPRMINDLKHHDSSPNRKFESINNNNGFFPYIKNSDRELYNHKSDVSTSTQSRFHEYRFQENDEVAKISNLSRIPSKIEKMPKYYLFMKNMRMKGNHDKNNSSKPLNNEKYRSFQDESTNILSKSIHIENYSDFGKKEQLFRSIQNEGYYVSNIAKNHSSCSFTTKNVEFEREDCYVLDLLNNKRKYGKYINESKSKIRSKSYPQKNSNQIQYLSNENINLENLYFRDNKIHQDCPIDFSDSTEKKYSYFCENNSQKQYIKNNFSYMSHKQPKKMHFCYNKNIKFRICSSPIQGFKDKFPKEKDFVSDDHFFCENILENTSAESNDLICNHCGTLETSLWRRVDRKMVCNACGLYYKMHKRIRPISLKKSNIKKRRRLFRKKPVIQ